MKVDIDITDYTEEITAGIKAAIKRALIRIGLDAETYAKKAVHVVTGRLRNSITHFVKGNSVFIGSNVEYARYEEEGTSKRPRTRICALLSQTTWTSGSKSLLWAGYRGGTPDFTRGGYHFFTLCTVSLEKIANLPNGIMGRKSRGNPKNGLGIPRLFAFWKTVLKFRFGTGSAFTDGLQPFPNPIGAGTQEERCWKDSRSGDMPRRSCRIHG